MSTVATRHLIASTRLVTSALALLLAASFAQSAAAMELTPSPRAAAFLVPGQAEYKRQNYAGAINQVRLAQRLNGLSSYDRYLIDELLGASLLGEKNYVGAGIALERSFRSPHFDPARTREMAEMLTRVYHQGKNQAKAAAFGEEAIGQGSTAEDIYLITGSDLNTLKDYERARRVLLGPVRDMIREGREPSKQLLGVLAFSCRNSGDLDCANEFTQRAAAAAKGAQ